MPVVEFYGVLLVALIGYLAPIGAALLYRRRRLGRIALVNVLAGWTVIGWFVAMAMAFADERLERDPEGARGPEGDG